jgi:hypothetical protein
MLTYFLAYIEHVRYPSLSRAMANVYWFGRVLSGLPWAMSGPGNDSLWHKLYHGFVIVLHVLLGAFR